MYKVPETLIKQRVEEGLIELRNSQIYGEATCCLRDHFERVKNYLPEERAHDIMDDFERALIDVNTIEYHYLYEKGSIDVIEMYTELSKK